MPSLGERNIRGRRTERSEDLVTVGYYLSRMSWVNEAGVSCPPRALKVEKWREAYDLFFDAVSDGRDLKPFERTLRNTRDSFDPFHENGRTGWVPTAKRADHLMAVDHRVHAIWADKEDAEIECHIFGLLERRSAFNGAASRAATIGLEGRRRITLSNAHERSAQLRREAIRLHGTDCHGCGFSFGATYGALGDGFIEIHHLDPLFKRGEGITDPAVDLVPLCANCHRMVHRTEDVLDLDALRALLG